MNPRGVQALLGFIAPVVHWSRGDTIDARQVQTLLGFIAWVLH